MGAVREPRDMPSHVTALALAALIVLAGCAALPGGEQTDTATATPVEHHELVLSSIIVPYEATVTVTDDGETVLAETVSGDASDAYATIGTLEDPGPYTVTVNTSIERYDGTLSDRFRIDADPGTATAIRMNHRGIRADTFDLPRHNATYPLGAYSSYVNVGGSEELDLDVRVWYQGERIATTTTAVSRDELTRVVPLEDSGVYRVSARTAGDWTNATVVLDDPETYIVVEIGAQGDVSTIRVKPAYEWGNPS